MHLLPIFNRTKRHIKVRIEIEYWTLGSGIGINRSQNLINLKLEHFKPFLKNHLKISSTYVGAYSYL